MHTQTQFLSSQLISSSACRRTDTNCKYDAHRHPSAARRPPRHTRAPRCPTHAPYPQALRTPRTTAHARCPRRVYLLKGQLRRHQSDATRRRS